MSYSIVLCLFIRMKVIFSFVKYLRRITGNPTARELYQRIKIDEEPNHLEGTRAMQLLCFDDSIPNKQIRSLPFPKFTSLLYLQAASSIPMGFNAEMFLSEILQLFSKIGKWFKLESSKIKM